MHKSFWSAHIALTFLATAAVSATAASKLEFDHVWIMVSPNAPERAALVRAGLQISPDVNRHTGQGTASITVEFQNAFLELMWPDSTVPVAPGLERVAEKFKQRMLWRTSGWCPIGIGFHRTTQAADETWPFPTWSTTAPWLPAGSAHVMLTPRDDTQSPSLFISPRTLEDAHAQEVRASLYHHSMGVQRVTSIRLISPNTYQPIESLTYLQELHVIDLGRGEEWLVELTFDGGKNNKSQDLRPSLPLVLRY
jgi:hypothetical protein